MSSPGEMRGVRLNPVVQQSTPMIIAAQVREAIALGHFPPGAQMYETQLAEQLGVSRGPLREGLQRLTQEGLLVAVRHRGLFVVELTPENVRDMYLAREAIERCAVAIVVTSNPVATAEALDEVLNRMEAAAVAGDSAQVGECDIHFHEVLVAQSGSERLARLHATQVVEARICIHALGSSGEDDRHRVQEHCAIAEAIRAADAELADQLLRRHMLDAVQELMAVAPAGGSARAQ
ncbi:MAG: GntR family transcriptional regulator [Ornithinimicrobium sp.]